MCFRFQEGVQTAQTDNNVVQDCCIKLIKAWISKLFSCKIWVDSQHTFALLPLSKVLVSLAL